MKIKKLILDMNYTDEFKKKMALRFMTFNNYWMEELSKEWVSDNNFLEASSHKEILEKLNEINYILYFAFYQQIEEWTQKISNNRELAEDVIRENFEGAKFEIAKMEDGIVEVNFIEPVDYPNRDWLYCQDESSIRDVTDDMYDWEKDINITLGEKMYEYGDDVKTYEYKVNSDWTYDILL